MSLTFVIPSKSIANLAPCVAALRKYEPEARIIVADDGVDWSANAALKDSLTVVECPKPFIFSRNCNLGIEASGEDDVVLLNDDAVLCTDHGFTAIQRLVQENAEYGAVSAVTNLVCNGNQKPQHTGTLREEKSRLCFMCVFLPRTTLRTVGTLDEQFVAYGWEDDDYSLRVLNAGLKLGVYDGCFVDHESLESSFRIQNTEQYDTVTNRKLFEDKWRKKQQTWAMLRVKNEARWIEKAIASLRPLCDHILVLDNGSSDGTPDICRTLGCKVFNSAFTDFHEARDKDFLLNQIWRAGASIGDYVINIDGDEAIHPDDIGTLGLFMSMGLVCGSMKILYLWDEEDQVRVDRWYATFARPSVFRLTGRELAFRRTAEDGTIHCSAAPYQSLQKLVALPVRLLHYGYMVREDRIRKYHFYNALDPNNAREDGYRHMVIGDLFPAESSFVWAGPLQLERLHFSSQ